MEYSTLSLMHIYLVRIWIIARLQVNDMKRYLIAFIFSLFLILMFLVSLYYRDDSMYLPIVTDEGAKWSSFPIEGRAGFLDEPMKMGSYLQDNAWIMDLLSDEMSSGSDDSQQYASFYLDSLENSSFVNLLYEYSNKNVTTLVYRFLKGDDKTCYYLRVNKSKNKILMDDSGFHGVVGSSFSSLCNQPNNKKKDDHSLIEKISFIDFIRYRLLGCFGGCGVERGVLYYTELDEYKLNKIKDIIKVEIVSELRVLAKGGRPVDSLRHVRVGIDDIFASSQQCVVVYRVFEDGVIGSRDMAYFECGDEVELKSLRSPPAFQWLFSGEE